MHFRGRLLRWLIVSCCASPAVLSRAQDKTLPTYTRQEVSAGFGGTLRDVAGYGNPPSLYAVGTVLGRYTYNLSPSLGVEATFRYSGYGPYYGGSTDGGTETFGGAGMKAGVRRGAWQFFGTAEPGLVSFSRGSGGCRTPDPSSCFGDRYTHFALDLGMGVQRNFGRRTFVRLDAGTLLAAEFDKRISSVYQNGVLVLYQQTTGRTADFFESSFSIGHAFGAMHTESDPDTSAPKGSVGAFFPLYGLESMLSAQMNMNRGLGVWASLPVAKHLDLDAAGFQFPQFDRTGFFQDGGKRAFAAAGIRAGMRRDRLGMFVKLRAGAIRFTNTYGGSSFATEDEYFNTRGHNTYQPLVDLGGVVEAYPRKHLVLRAEVGPTLVVYRPTTFTLTGKTYAFDANHETGMLVAFGLGYRF